MQHVKKGNILIAGASMFQKSFADLDPNLSFKKFANLKF